MNKITDTVIKILGRQPEPSEGLSPDAINSAESKLGVKLPPVLREFYQSVGKMPIFTDAFEFFAQPKQIYIKSNKLIFLEENQAMLSWGIDLNEINSDEVKVYHSPNIGEAEKNVVWHTETLLLPDFLEMIMYYQVASADTELQQKTKGAYPYDFMTYKSELKGNNLWDNFEKEMSAHWNKVVDNNGLMIYHTQDALLLYYTVQDLDTDVDDLIYVNTKKENTQAEFLNKYGFEELN